MFGAGSPREADDLAAQAADQATPTWSKARQALIDGVKAYAQAHYTDGGWDVIVECWDDAQIYEATKTSRTINGAVTNSTLSACVDVWADQQADAVNSAF
jgi:hypothetical protein